MYKNVHRINFIKKIECEYARIFAASSRTHTVPHRAAPRHERSPPPSTDGRAKRVLSGAGEGASIVLAKRGFDALESLAQIGDFLPALKRAGLPAS